MMDNDLSCYCGLYCKNCHVLAKISPAAKNLLDEMKTAGFSDIIHYIPGGEGFWSFLSDMAENGLCVSCRSGSGNPGCVVRICAKDREVEMCALCESYPCEYFDKYFPNYPTLTGDNELLRAEGKEAWLKMQEERRNTGFTYTDLKTVRVNNNFEGKKDG